MSRVVTCHSAISVFSADAAVPSGHTAATRGEAVPELGLVLMAAACWAHREVSPLSLEFSGGPISRAE